MRHGLNLPVFTVFCCKFIVTDCWDLSLFIVSLWDSSDRWQKEFFENGAAAFEKTDRRMAEAQQRRTAELEARLKKKDNVIAEIMEDLINEKKRPGGL